VAEKLRIVREAAACTKRGAAEVLPRREGIFSSHLAAGHRQLERHGSEALAAGKPGRKPKLETTDRRIAERGRDHPRRDRRDERAARSPTSRNDL
jgi:transposase